MLRKCDLTREERRLELQDLHGRLLITESNIAHQKEHGDCNIAEQQECKRDILAQMEELS